MRRIALTLSIVLSLTGFGCMANTGPSDDGTTLGGKADGDERALVEVFESDDGTAVQVPEGADVVLRLSSNPSTGYGWHVVSTDRTFGYPETSFEGPGADGPVGSGGTEVMTWRTDGPLIQVGETHTVELAYSRGEGGTAARTFELVVEIVDAVAPAPEVQGVELGVDDDGATVQVVEGGDVVVRLPENPSTGYEWSVASTDRTFGYPEVEFEVDETGAIGSGGIAVLTWHTGGFVRAGGVHTVDLRYGRPSEPEAEPEATFTFTVEIVEAEPAPEPEPEAPEAVVLLESNDGDEVGVVEGADVVVRLSANATTGYQWFVTSTDRTFGYPEQTYEYAEGGPVGSGGTAVLTWHTGGFVRAGGSHTVTLVYARSASGSPARTFTFTANVVAAD